MLNLSAEKLSEMGIVKFRKHEMKISFIEKQKHTFYNKHVGLTSYIDNVDDSLQCLIIVTTEFVHLASSAKVQIGIILEA